jgi:hypothetical protein
MISLDRLQQIIPSDQALANKALSVALGQITGINNLTLPRLAAVSKNVATTKDLPIITALAEAVPASVANYYTSTLAQGTGVNGSVQIVDILGLASGYPATNAFTRTVELFGQMDLAYLTLIYTTMYHVLNGDYGDTGAGPLTIPVGLPCAGTYIGNEIITPNPDPPPPSFTTYDPSAADLAIACLTGAAATEINNLQATYPSQTTELNTLWNQMAQQVVTEQYFQNLIALDYANLTPNSRNAIYGFIFSLPDYGLQTEQGGMAQFIENMADLTTQAGEAVVASLRQGRNSTALNSVGISTNSRIPVAPNPPPPEANLLPADYTQAEANATVIP